MSAAWVVNTVSLFLVAVGGLLILLYLIRSPRFEEEWLTPEGRRAYRKQRTSLVVAVGLLATWIVLQYVWIIL